MAKGLTLARLEALLAEVDGKELDDRKRQAVAVVEGLQAEVAQAKRDREAAEVELVALKEAVARYVDAEFEHGAYPSPAHERNYEEAFDKLKALASLPASSE